MSLHTCLRVLDVGAGDGWFTSELEDWLPQHAEIVCWDVNYSATDLKEVNNRTVEPPRSTFDLILALDVIEHVSDDSTFVTDQILSRAHPNTLIVVSVPAYQRLFSRHDELLGHYRRYDIRTLINLFEDNCSILERGGLFTSLIPARAVAVALEPARRSPPQGIGGWQHGKAITRMVTSALNADATLCRWGSRRQTFIPGLSVWLVCRLR